MHFNFREQHTQLVEFLKAKLVDGDDILTVTRKAWQETGCGLMGLCTAVMDVQEISHREAARITAKATFEIKRERTGESSGNRNLK